MRRVLLVALLSATLTVLPSAYAQRAAHPGGSSAGHPAGGFGGARVGSSAGHYGGSIAGGSFGRSPRFVNPGTLIGPRAPNAVSTARTHSFAPSYRVPYAAPGAGWRDGGRGNHDRDRDRRYRSPYPGYGYGYGGYPYVYANSWELLPGDVDASDFAGYPDDSESNVQQQPAASAAPPDESSRPDYEAPAEEPYPYAQPPADNQFASSPVAPEPALTLIFNDGHQETIHNYVLTSEAVIVLDQAASGRQTRIPLASLNLAATAQAAQQAGLDFTPPA